jgi:hypothetical protein
MTTDLIPVRVGGCLCPGTPHADGDFVYLRPKLGLAGGIVVQSVVQDAIRNRVDANVSIGLLADAYLSQGVADWNLVDDKGDPIPILYPTLRTFLLDDFERSIGAANVADELYRGPVVDPLVTRVLASMESLRSTPTNGSTSPQSGGGSKHPRRSKRSSTTTSPTAATGTTT